jgi:hypothetical protein
MASGGTFDTTDARLYFDVSVPQTFTFQTTLTFDYLPPNFNSLASDHIVFMVSDSSGPTAAVFFSAIGIAYAGAVHFDGSGHLVLDSTFQPLPNSQTLLQTGVQYTFRMAVDSVTGAAYIYFTETDLLPSIGQQLRYVLPAFLSADMAQVPLREVLISVSGTLARPAQITMAEIGLGTGLIIPVVPPVANAGLDQAVRTCTIVQLDGSRSIDPQGGPLTYLWQLVDGPTTSAFVFDGNDGNTIPLLIPTGFTDHFYSQEAGDLFGQDSFVAGDVLLVASTVFVIESTGTDGHGFFIRITGYDLPDNLGPLAPFKIVRQRGISGPTQVKATFLPDVPGIFKFNLTVNNGALSSFPSECIVNVTVSFLPRGIVPDLSFLWDYLSDFWKLVEDRERIEIFWSALAQVASAELLSLWQIDYGKSLRDVQRTFQRRWLHYDLLLNEQPGLIELSTVRAVYGGLESIDIPTAGISGVAGRHLDLFLSTQTDPIVIFFSGADPQTAQSIVDQINGYMHAIDPTVVARVVPKKNGLSSRVRIDAPFGFAVSSTSTLTLFGLGTNGIAKGTAGTVMGIRSYRVERSLAHLAVKQGDFLTIEDTTFRIAQVIDDSSDDYYFQRVNTLDDIPGDIGTNWLISGQATSTSLNFYSALVTAGDAVTLEVIDLTTNLIDYVTVPATGACAAATGTLGIDASMIGHFIVNPNVAVYFVSVTRRQYTPIDSLVVDVPHLQQYINNTDDSQVIHRNLDYFLTTHRGVSCIQFMVSNDVTKDIWEGLTPPPRLWAETTYIDNRPVIEASFGIPASFTLDDLSTLPSNVDYLSSVRGLWYAYFNGPTVFNIRAGTQILLGLPFAEEMGVITEIRDDFSVTSGRILVQDTANTEITRSYSFPPSLSLEVNPATGKPYVVGDTVLQYAPLVKGVEVLDRVNSPKWFGGYVNQGALHEVEKFFKFMVRVDSAAFNLNALLYVKSFILRIKPTYTYPVFVVKAAVASTEVVVSDGVARSGFLNLYEGPCFHGPAWNVAGMWDQPRASGGGEWSAYDNDGVTTPTFPDPTLPVPWGFDRNFICPEYVIRGALSFVWPGGIPAYDEIFSYDLPLSTHLYAEFGGHSISSIAVSPVYTLGEYIVGSTGTTDTIYLEVSGGNGGGNPFTLEFRKNNVLVHSTSFTKGSSGRDFQAFPMAVPLTIGDVLEVRVIPSTPYAPVDWHDIYVAVLNATPWAFDTVFPAGSYTRYRSM